MDIMEGCYRIKQGDGLKDHVEVKFIHDTNVQDFHLLTGAHRLDIVHKFAEWEVDVIHKGEDFMVTRDDYSVSIVYFQDVCFPMESDILRQEIVKH